MLRHIALAATTLAATVVSAQTIPLFDSETALFRGGDNELRMGSELLEFGEATGGDLRGVEYVGTELVRETEFAPELTRDTANATPFDNINDGTFWQRISIPADSQGRPVSHRITASGFIPGSGTLKGRIFIGSGSTPSRESVVCEGSDGSFVGCHTTIQHPGGSQPAEFWVLLWNRNGSASSGALRFHSLPLRAAGDTATHRLDVSGPSLVREGSPLRTLLQVTNPTQTDDESLHGAVLVYSGSPKRLIAVNEREITVFSITADFAYQLRPGADFETSIRPTNAAVTQLANRFFIDVPPNSRRLTISTRANGNIDLHAIREDFPTNARETLIQPAPFYSASAGFTSSATPGGNESVTFNNPAPGRYKVSITGTDSRWVRTIVRADLEASSNTVRPGAYFNAERPGHGLFVYPAGASFAGLYYTYVNNLNRALEFDTPTWYYIQGALPGADGIWRGQVFRSNWLGTANTLSRVGEMVLTPRGTDAFQFTISIDGVWYSQPYASFGRGCPSAAGVVRDVNGHWFDPAKAGTGYSVQLFPNYEFYAFFGYDQAGSARYLAGELSRLGGTTESMPLDQIRGYSNALTPSTLLRTTVGTLTRTFNGGTLSNITVSGNLAAPLTGPLSQSDTVISLGSPQGCQP